MGIRCYCPNGHKLNLKPHLAGQRGICPKCGVSFLIPTSASSEHAEPPAPPLVPPKIPTASVVPPEPVPETPTEAEVPLAPEATDALDIPLASEPIIRTLPTTPTEFDGPEELSKIAISEHQKIMATRALAKRGTRNVITLFLGAVAFLLLVILWRIL